MKVLRTALECREFHGCDFVPTMGALHRGHEALIGAARRASDRVLVSIFVNPTQFGPREDFLKYPRPIEEDLEICRRAGVSAVFAPEADEIYPAGFATQVAVPALSGIMCGADRPGHFEGVCTVVARLFAIVRPVRAWFGWKDAQQLLIVRRMTRDLELGPEIMGVEIIREDDGLAISSRNRFLTPAGRIRAAGIHAALQAGRAAARRGESAAGIWDAVSSELIAASIDYRYVELRHLPDLADVTKEAVPRGDGGDYLLAIAVVIDGVRLIDNLRFSGKVL